MSSARPDENLLLESGELILVSAAHASGAPRETRLPFAYADGAVYLLARADADWYRDVEKDRGVVVRIGRRGFRGRAIVFDAKQRTKAAGQIADMFRRKFGAGLAQKWNAPLPVMIHIDF
jgi:hypothetical protein